MAVASHATAGQVTVGDFVSVDELVQPAQQPAVQQKQTANVVADLETILQERDACGVSGQFMLYLRLLGDERSLSSWLHLDAGRFHRQPEECTEPQGHRAGRIRLAAPPASLCLRIRIDDRCTHFPRP